MHIGIASCIPTDQFTQLGTVQGCKLMLHAMPADPPPRAQHIAMCNQKVTCMSHPTLPASEGKGSMQTCAGTQCIDLPVCQSQFIAFHSKLLSQYCPRLYLHMKTCQRIHCLSVGKVQPTCWHMQAAHDSKHPLQTRCHGQLTPSILITAHGLLHEA